MSWIIYGSYASLISAFVLVLFYYYLYSLDKERYLAYWALGWSFHTIRFLFEIGMTLAGQNPWLFIGNQLFTFLSGLLILLGTYDFLDKKVPKLITYGAIGCCCWIFIGVFTDMSFMLITFPTYSGLALIYILNGVAFLTNKDFKPISKNLVGWSSVLWGIHKADYPFLRQIEWFAPWGFLIGGVYSLILGIGLIQIYFLKIKHDLAASEGRFRLLAENAKRYQILFENARDIIMFIGLEGEIIDANQAAVNAYGYSREELLAKKIYNLRAAGTNHLTKIQMQQAYAGGIIFETMHCRKDGSVFSVEVSSKGITYFDETILVSIIRDINERKKSEEAMLRNSQKLAQTVAELEKSNRELDQFAYVVSHDLKAPLRAIANLSQWIKEDLGEAVKGDTLKHMDMLKGRVRRMENFIEGILLYSRVGKTNGNDQKVDVEELLKEIIEELAPPAGIVIEIERGCMPTLITDRFRLRQVLVNLIDNALKYNDRPDGYLKIAVKDRKEFFEFSLSDNGPGIAPEYHEKIFEIFQTLQPRDQVESTGIGLSLVKKIVEAKGGKVWVESAAGAGATFSFLWPKG